MMLNSVKTKGGTYFKTAILENPASRGGKKNSHPFASDTAMKFVPSNQLR